MPIFPGGVMPRRFDRFVFRGQARWLL